MVRNSHFMCPEACRSIVPLQPGEHVSMPVRAEPSPLSPDRLLHQSIGNVASGSGGQGSWRPDFQPSGSVERPRGASAPAPGRVCCGFEQDSELITGKDCSGILFSVLIPVAKLISFRRRSSILFLGLPAVRARYPGAHCPQGFALPHVDVWYLVSTLCKCPLIQWLPFFFLLLPKTRGYSFSWRVSLRCVLTWRCSSKRVVSRAIKPDNLPCGSAKRRSKKFPRIA